jgi:hypothetical protein
VPKSTFTSEFRIMSEPPSGLIAFRVGALITAINVLISAGFSIAGVIAPQTVAPAGSVPGQAALIFALYALARALAIAGVTLVLIYKRASSSLLAMGALAGVVQCLDAGVGLVQGDAQKVIGPLAIAALQFAALWWVRRSTPVRVSAM